MIMDAAESANTPDPQAVVPVTRAARVFHAELVYQRIAPADAVSTVSLLTRDAPSASVEGFVTIEAARMLVAKTVYEAARAVPLFGAELLVMIAQEIAPDEIPPAPSASYRSGDGDLVWACCQSTIGPVCHHKLPPRADMALLAEKRDDEGRWVRRNTPSSIAASSGSDVPSRNGSGTGSDADPGKRYESIPPSHMERLVRHGPAAQIRRITVSSDSVIVEVPASTPLLASVSPTVVIYDWVTFPAAADSQA